MKELYVVHVPGGIEGIFEKESIKELLKKYYLEEDINYMNIIPYEINVVYDGNTIPEMIDHKKWWHELNKEGNQ